MEKPLTQNQIASGTAADPLSLEAMAYYQGADFILKHRMNRWEYARRVDPVVARVSH